METAQNARILITSVGTYLGTHLALELMESGHQVWGQGATHYSQKLLTQKSFTLLEIDLAQPLPAYLPKFDIIFDFTLLKNYKDYGHLSANSPQILNLQTLAKKDNSQLFIFAPLTSPEDFYEQLTSAQDLKEKTNLILTGNIYGPDMPHQDDDKLSNLITQAAKSDKIILENEGLDNLYPIYIQDAIEIVKNLAFENQSKKIHYLSSHSAITTLTCSYEIQNALRQISGKEIGLFFSGPQKQVYPEPEIVIKSHIAQKTNLPEGLRNTFDGLLQGGQVQKLHEVAANYHVHAQFVSPRPYEKPPETDNRKTKNMPSFKIPSLNLKNTKAIVFVALIFLLMVGKTALDLYLGQKNIKSAQKTLMLGDFDKAQSQAKNAEKSFHAAQNKISILTYPLSFIIPQKRNDVKNLLESARLASSATVFFIEGAKQTSQSFSQISKPDIKNEGFDPQNTASNFKKAYSDSSKSFYLLKTNTIASQKLKPFQNQVEKLQMLSQNGYDLTQLTPAFIGQGKKTYLVLMQNNTELRPGGGFIGNYALVEFDGGKLKNIEVDDIYNIDGQLKEKIEPPAPLKTRLGIDNFYMRDSNWSGDFELNSKTARDFFKKETGRDVDGVIAVDLTLVQEILQKMGPITLSDYKDKISAENLFQKGEYYSEVGFFPGSTQKKDFFGALTRAMVANIVTSLQKSNSTKDQTTAAPLLALVEGIAQGLPQKHFMITLNDPTLASYIKTKNYNSPLPPNFYNVADDSKQTRDFVAIVEANVGANKVNRTLERKVSYEMTIGKDADLVGKLTVTYTNNSQAETWPGGKYVNYLRIYVPFAASLFAYQNGDSTDLKQVESTLQGPLTVFSTYVEVPVKSSKTVTFTYRIPKNIKLETAPTYSIYFEKQAGTEKDPLEFKFNLPAYLQIASVNGDQKLEGQQNITIDSNLETDRMFTVEVNKK